MKELDERIELNDIQYNVLLRSYVDSPRVRAEPATSAPESGPCATTAPPISNSGRTPQTMNCLSAGHEPKLTKHATRLQNNTRYLTF